jgi:hypothetical protein
MATSTFVSTIQPAPKWARSRTPKSLIPGEKLTRERRLGQETGLSVPTDPWWKSMPGKVAVYTKTHLEARKNILPNLDKQYTLLQEEFFAKTCGKTLSGSKFLTFRWKAGIFPQKASLFKSVRIVPDYFR